MGDSFSVGSRAFLTHFDVWFALLAVSSHKKESTQKSDMGPTLPCASPLLWKARCKGGRVFLCLQEAFTLYGVRHALCLLTLLPSFGGYPGRT